MRRLSKPWIIKLIPILFLFFLFNCQKESSTESDNTEQLKDLYGKVPNPASVYCQEMGYKSELREDASGNQYEVCIFPDGSECRSWDFLKGKCGQKFSCCEKQGNRIETRVQDMGTWKMEYAVCIFPDSSESPEWEFFQEKQNENSSTQSEEEQETENLYAGYPNPAAVYCRKLEYKYEIRKTTSGGQAGVCIFPDGSECSGWAFLKGQCGQEFSFCEKQGYKIENRVKDMGTWTANYAVCVFPDGSERSEWEFFLEKLKEQEE